MVIPDSTSISEIWYTGTDDLPSFTCPGEFTALGQMYLHLLRDLDIPESATDAPRPSFCRAMLQIIHSEAAKRANKTNGDETLDALEMMAAAEEAAPRDCQRLSGSRLQQLFDMTQPAETAWYARLCLLLPPRGCDSTPRDYALSLAKLWLAEIASPSFSTSGMAPAEITEQASRLRLIAMQQQALRLPQTTLTSLLASLNLISDTVATRHGDTAPTSLLSTLLDTYHLLSCGLSTPVSNPTLLDILDSRALRGDRAAEITSITHSLILS